MKIAITGAHRVGKTTLAEKLLGYLSNYELRAEPYYELEELGYVFSDTPNVDDFVEQLEYTIKQISISEDDVIFDRCPIDLLAYIQAIDGAGSIEPFYHKVHDIIQEIDLLVFVPIDDPDLIPCPESEFSELRQQVDEILNEWIEDFDVETVVVAGSLLERVNQVIKKVSQE